MVEENTPKDEEVKEDSLDNETPEDQEAEESNSNIEEEYSEQEDSLESNEEESYQEAGENSSSMKKGEKILLRTVWVVIGVALIAVLFFAMKAPGSAVGTAAAISTYDANTNAASANAAAGSDNVAASSSDVQVVKLSVQGSNYVLTPNTVKKGIPVRIEADVSSLPGCSRSIVMSAFNVRASFTSSNNAVEFTPNKAGTFNIACSMNMFKGQLTVLEADGSKASYVEKVAPSGGGCGMGGGGGCGGGCGMM